MEPLFKGEDELLAVGRAAAERAWTEGMTVLRPDGKVVPIPLLCEPEVLSRAALDLAAAQAERILSASVKLARALVGSGDARDRAALSEPFSGLEAEAMGRLFEAPLPVLVARVDYLYPEGSAKPRALELNATIPAMPAYADIATFSWLRAAARARGMSPREEGDLVASCGSHMERLREALVAFYRQRGGTAARPSIALVARKGDAQIGELRRLATISGRWATGPRTSPRPTASRRDGTSSTGTSGPTASIRRRRSPGRCASPFATSSPTQ